MLLRSGFSPTFPDDEAKQFCSIAMNRCIDRKVTGFYSNFR